MSTLSDNHSSPNATPGHPSLERLRSARVLLAGLGNIGSFLAVLLGPRVAFIRLVDRDTVEIRNIANQLYGPEHAGQAKVDAAAERIARLAPSVVIERRIADLEDVPWEDFADVDVVLAGLDSLRARQILSEKLGPLQIPYIDGAVGDELLIRVQVLLPGQACLECSWGPGQYRQLGAEYPCRPGAKAAAPPTVAPGCAGAATAGAMVAQCLRLFGANPPRESYEINGDLKAGRMVASSRRRNARCRYSHEVAPRRIGLEKAFAEATVADLIDVATRQLGHQDVQFEFRRGILATDQFAPGCFARPEQLYTVGDQRLSRLGLTERDRVVVRAIGQAPAAHICLDARQGIG
jgi:molybdopterin/thiamine biosynthesis adenylyltransferase